MSWRKTPLRLLWAWACVALVLGVEGKGLSGWPRLAVTSDAPAEKAPCMKDATKGLQDADNVYYCKGATEKCCVTNDTPACCPERDSSKDLIQQVIIWAAVVVLVVVIALVFICWRKDSKLCKGSSCKECLDHCCHRRVQQDKYSFDGVLIMGTGPSNRRIRKRVPASSESKAEEACPDPAVPTDVATLPGTVDEYGPARGRPAPSKEGKRKAKRKPRAGAKTANRGKAAKKRVNKKKTRKA